MAKYNITEKKEKEATYRTLVSPKLMDEMKERILEVIVMQKKYKDKDYSAGKLAEELGTNTRYISAVVNVRFTTSSIIQGGAEVLAYGTAVKYV